MARQRTEQGTWVLRCNECENDFYVKNCAIVSSKAEFCDWCQSVLDGGADIGLEIDRGVAAELGWCGCGSPSKVDRMMVAYLRSRALDEGFPPLDPEVVSEDVAMLLAYIADEIGWTEHGVSVSGAWLTEDGKQALANLERAMAT